MKNLRGLVSPLCLCFIVSTLLVAEADAEVVDSETGGPITLPEGISAQPYPSLVKLEGADGEIVDVDVSIRITHGAPQHLDIAVRSPEGDASVLLSDACGTGDLTNADFVFDQDAATGVPGAAACPDGSVYRPANHPPSDPDIPGITGIADLDRLNGGDPNGIWELFVRDDEPTETGTVASWKVRVTTTRSEIVIPDAGTIGTADPYPSTKTFEAPVGQVIDDVDLLVDDFNHLHPDDVDMLLQGPDGAATMLMSDACDFQDIHDRDWEFDDEAPATLSDLDSAGCGAGPVRPSLLGAAEVLAPPAPAPPYGTLLSAYDGLDGGEWRLYVEDDGGTDTGFIGGWSAELTTRPAATTGFTDGFEEAREGSTVSFTVSRSGPTALGPARVELGVVPGSAGAGDLGPLPEALEFARGEASKTIAIPIVDDTEAEQAAETIEVALSSPQDDAALAGASAATVSIAPSDRNDFIVGKSKRRNDGSLELSVVVPGPGEVHATGRKIEPAKTVASAPGVRRLVLEPAAKARKRLRAGKRVKATVEVRFAPTGGTQAKQTAKVVFKPKRKSRP